MREVPAADAVRDRAVGGGTAAAASVGALVGLAWSAALRAYMVAIAGPGSTFSWWTLVAILLPGAVAGACLGLAVPLHRRGARRAWLLGLSPFAFAAATMLEPGALLALLTTGIGGGAIAVPAALVLGGVGIGSLGPRAVRIGCLVVALLLAVGLAAAVPAVGGAAVAATSPRGAWAIVLALSLMLTGMVGTGLAFRPVAAGGAPQR